MASQLEKGRNVKTKEESEGREEILFFLSGFWFFLLDFGLGT